MTTWQHIFLIWFFIGNCTIAYYAYLACRYKKQAFTEVPLLAPLGGFVWGDFLIFSPFWMLVSLISYLTQGWELFLFIFSVFWVVRSLGESIYWFNQQFSMICRNKPEDLRGYRFVKNDSIWYIYQIFWQCITVFSVVAALYTGHLWLASL